MMMMSTSLHTCTLTFPYMYIFPYKAVQSHVYTHCITVTDSPTGMVSMEWDSHFSTSVLYIPHHILLHLLQLTTILLVLWKRERPLDRQDNAFLSVLLLFKCLLHIHGHSSVDELITNSHDTYHYNLVLDCKMAEQPKTDMREM